MYLFIDTNESRFAFFQEKEAFDHLQWNNVVQEQSLAREIQKKHTEIEAIIVLQGKGGFSQTREGIVFANIFNQTKQTPILAVTDQGLESRSLDQILIDLKETGNKPLMPHYFAEANIS